MNIHIDLTAVDRFGKAVSSTNCRYRTDFVNIDREVIVTEYENGRGVVLKTAVGEYHLPKHKTQNLYSGSCLGYRVRITLKKMVGTLSYQGR